MRPTSRSFLGWAKPPETPILPKEYTLGFLKGILNGILKGIYTGSIKGYSLSFSRIPNVM